MPICSIRANATTFSAPNRTAKWGRLIPVFAVLRWHCTVIGAIETEASWLYGPRMNTDEHEFIWGIVEPSGGLPTHGLIIGLREQRK